MNLDLSSITPDRRAEFLADYQRDQARRAADKAREAEEERRASAVPLALDLLSAEEYRAAVLQGRENQRLRASPAYQKFLWEVSDLVAERTHHHGNLMGRAQTARREQGRFSRCSEWEAAKAAGEEAERWEKRAAALMQAFEAGDPDWRKLALPCSGTPWRKEFVPEAPREVGSPGEFDSRAELLQRIEASTPFDGSRPAPPRYERGGIR